MKENTITYCGAKKTRHKKDLVLGNHAIAYLAPTVSLTDIDRLS